jgi:hypothetical protein
VPVENPAPACFAASWLIASRIDHRGTNVPAPTHDVVAAGLDAKKRFRGVSDRSEVITMIGSRSHRL